MVSSTTTLNDIARGDATPKQARALLGALMRDASIEVAEDVYLAIRAWVWKALDQRRRDRELREWQDIISAVASLMKDLKRDLSAKLNALQELLWESVATGERLAAVDVTKRQHVAQVLAFLDGEKGFASRAEIGRRLSLRQANLSRVLNLMSSAGLLERLMLGREASFRLTRTGMQAAAANRPSSLSARPNSARSRGNLSAVDKRQAMLVMMKIFGPEVVPHRNGQRHLGETTDYGHRLADLMPPVPNEFFPPNRRFPRISAVPEDDRYQVSTGRREVFRTRLPEMVDG